MNAEKLLFDEHANADIKGLVIAVSFVALVTIVFNAIIIAAFIAHRPLRNFADLFILNTCIADLGVGLGLISQIVFYKQGKVWTGGLELCVLSLVATWECCIVSIISVVLIFLDRFVLVTYPECYRQRQSRRLSSLTLLSTWVVVFLLDAVPTLVLAGDRIPEGHCTLPYRRTGGSMITFSVLLFIPLFTLPLLTELVYINIKKLYVFVDKRKTLVKYGIRLEPRKLLPTVGPSRGFNPSKEVLVGSLDSSRARHMFAVGPSRSTCPSKEGLPGSGSAKALLHMTAGNSPTNTLSATAVKAQSQDLNASQGPVMGTQVVPVVSQLRIDSSKELHMTAENKPTNTLSVTAYKAQSQDWSTSRGSVMGTQLVPVVSQSRSVDRSERRHSSLLREVAGQNCCVAWLQSLQPLPRELEMDTTARHFSMTCKSKLLKEARLLWGLVLVFIACVAPLALMLLVRGICRTTSSTKCPVTSQSIFFELSTWLVQMTSTLHPLLFAVQHPRIRHVLLTWLQRCFSSSPRRGDN
ncbi:muscarinic acetylcholine receptor M3-like [Littorina saxatilis]|uniref:muscarinic acetylcholine receptor M3-like n=1 Tax=Littorina saxatilis TaxID=31220 RepID=UPI0038B472A5